MRSLRLLRSVLSVKDEFYHRHIVQYNLFAPVFEVFRAIPVGNNLVSSTVLEVRCRVLVVVIPISSSLAKLTPLSFPCPQMCDFIRTENIKSLLEYIVSKHLLEPMDLNGIISLEEIANPHVDTFKQLRKKHDENTTPTGGSRVDTDAGFINEGEYQDATQANGSISSRPPTFNKKALEDQRKFRETDEEENYFNEDFDEEEEVNIVPQQQTPTLPASEQPSIA